MTKDDELQASVFISAEMKRNYLRNHDAIFVCPMGTADDEYRQTGLSMTLLLLYAVNELHQSQLVAFAMINEDLKAEIVSASY